MKTTDKLRHDAVKAKFGQAVLEILANDQDWSSDTFQQIADVAVELGLAEADEDGYFREKDDTDA